LESAKSSAPASKEVLGLVWPCMCWQAPVSFAFKAGWVQAVLPPLPSLLVPYAAEASGLCRACAS